MANSMPRILIAILGICAIAWGGNAFLAYRAHAAIADTARRIFSGDRFSPAQLVAMRQQLDAVPAGPPHASTLSDVVIIRLLLLEDELKANRRPAASDIVKLQMLVSAALAQSPTNSFLWLTSFWLKLSRAESVDDNVNLLRMSYWFGPNEAWIAVKRNPLALGAFQSLPSDLAEQALSEFVGLVRSGLYAAAADILAGPGWATREQLLGRLVQVDEADRRRFARALAYKNLDGVTVPGVDERPSRPF